MCKRRAPGAYGFTTTVNDEFAVRVGKEAKANNDFILVLAAVNTPTHYTLTLLVRTSALPFKAAGFTLGGTPFGKTWGKKLPGTDFRAFTVNVDNPKRALNLAKAQYLRFKNHNKGRTVRVLVEAL